MNRIMNIALCMLVASLVVPAYGAKDEAYYEAMCTNANQELFKEWDVYYALHPQKKDKSSKDIELIHEKEHASLKKIVKLHEKMSASFARWDRCHNKQETLKDRVYDYADDAQALIKKHDKIARGIAGTTVVAAIIGVGYGVYKKIQKKKAQKQVN